jgi:hypothetical protein
MHTGGWIFMFASLALGLEHDDLAFWRLLRASTDGTEERD